MSDVPPTPMSPGAVLDGRYRMEVLLSEHNGARFWRATDTVLERSVAVHVVASTDPRAPEVLEAARRSAGVSDPHFLRVLDCDDVDGLTWVINEWGDGTSLDVMLAQGSLPPMRAAWLTREVAEAIAAAHAKGLVHGRLNPEAVLVTESGAVKIIGFVVNAAFDRPRSPDSPYGTISPREADVVDLAGILYAALTGRWPGVAPSAVPRAPREGNRPLRPRQVRAGVPRTLDTICDRVLHKEAAQHVMPIETAHEIAAALSDFVGDPAAVAPVDVPSMHDDPEAPTAEPPAEPAPVIVPADPDLPVVEEVAQQPSRNPDPEPDVEPDVETSGHAVVEAEPEPAREPELPAAAIVTDPDATMAAPAPFSPSGIEYLEPEEWEPAAPPPPFEQPVDRPLFAAEERRVPPGAPVGSGPPDSAWPFDDELPAAPQPPRSRKRFRARVLILLLMVVALCGAGYVGYRSSTSDDPTTPGSRSTATTTTSTPPEPVITGSPVPIVKARDFDPEGVPPEENPEQVRFAIDGKPTTAWKTSVYTQSNLGGLKSGVGLVLDLGEDREVGSVEVTLVGSPTSIELWAASPGTTDEPVELADVQRIDGITTDGTTATFRLDAGTQTRFLVLWLTNLPKVARGYQSQIADVMVRS